MSTEGELTATSRPLSNITSSVAFSVRIAAERGLPKAATKCGDLLYSGLGVLKANKTQAIEYYKQAAEAGDAQAFNNMGLIYESGYDGNPPDYEEAAVWYERGIQNKCPDAMTNYAILVQNVRPASL